MWLKLLGGVVPTRGISNAGITFTLVLNKLSSCGRYDFTLYNAFPIRFKIPCLELDTGWSCSNPT
jgi:hypothetical protein